MMALHGRSSIGACGRLAVVAGFCIALAAGDQAAAQTSTQPKPNTSIPSATPPAQPGQTPPPAQAAPKFPEPKEPGPYVRRTDISYWAFKMYLRMSKGGETTTEDGQRLNYRYQLPFETATVVFPLLPETSSSVARPAEAEGELKLGDVEFVKGKFLPPGSTINTSLIPHQPEILDRHFTGAMYHSGVRFAKFAAGELGKPRSAIGIGFLIDVPMMTSNTEFDEKAALTIPWPQGPWPEAAATTFGPQQWIDFAPTANGQIQRYNEDVFAKLISRWLNGQDPKKNFTPVGLAKVLIQGMVKDIRPDFNLLNYRLERPITGAGDDPNKIVAGGGTFLVGLQVRGAEFAATSPGATEWDLAALGCAIFRRCGLPTRLVVGFDKREEEEKDKGRNLNGKPRAWFEFYLYDEARNTGNWVICDPYRMRKSMAQTPPLDTKWKYFGNHDEMASVLPFAFHFIPPTDVRSYGAPGFWGWMVTPATPSSADTSISFTARKTAIPKDAPKDRENKSKPFR